MYISKTHALVKHTYKYIYRHIYSSYYYISFIPALFALRVGSFVITTLELSCVAKDHDTENGLGTNRDTPPLVTAAVRVINTQFSMTTQVLLGPVLQKVYNWKPSLACMYVWDCYGKGLACS